jgi:putative tryptophan/tyrosine transport system substrate-binding protein
VDRPIICLALAALLLALSLPAEAQQPKKIARIGYVFGSTPAATAHNIEAFRRGLRELGHFEGKTFVLELRYGEARAERFPEIARELVSLKVDVIVAATDVAIAAVKRETQNPDSDGDKQRSGRDRVGGEPRTSRRKCYRAQH